MKVAIIIPTMNRPDFILRQLRFYESINSPHPIYLLDSSNEENAKKIKEGIKQYKNLNITYQWAPPGKDHLHSLLPLVEEKYCIQIGDEDFIIPKTISECAEFLENHPDYATCKGKQVNFRFQKEDYNKPYGLIAQQTLPLGRSVEDEDMLARAKNFWSDPIFLGYTVRRVEVEKSIHNITKDLLFMGDMTEFLIMSILIISGKSKAFDKLGCVMQISDLRSFDHSITNDFELMGKEWSMCEKEFSEIIQEKNISVYESLRVAKWILILYLSHQFSSVEAISQPTDKKDFTSSIWSKRNIFIKIKNVISKVPFVKKIYYKLNSPKYVDRPESIYYSDFKIVKEFLENK